MKETNNSWVVDLNNQNMKVNERSKEYANRKKIDRLFFCLTCNHVWESFYLDKTGIQKYSALSSYKLERKTCKQCKGVKNG